MLIRVPQHAAEDIAAWERASRQDALVARSRRHQERVARAVEALLEFVGAGPCYAGVSWGKDSVCLAHLVATHAPIVPLVWFHAGEIENPYCASVRDAFLARWPCRYQEIPCPLAAPWDGVSEHDGAQAEFERLSRHHCGGRYLSGVRAAESAPRRLRMRRHGHSTARTCAPLGWWRTEDVWAYLHEHGLPVHPQYAMTLGGKLGRDRLRVGTLGGERGRGFGRASHEQRYYGWRLAEIRAAARRAGNPQTALPLERAGKPG